MKSSGNPQASLNSGRDWTAIPDQDKLLEWSLDPEGDFLQGPLDLTCMRGKKVFLNLMDEQLALLTEEDELRAIYLDGGHVLDIGSRQGQISPQSRLYFLDPNRSIVLRWTFGSPIALPGEPVQHIIGACHLNVTGPTPFFLNFLKAAPVPDLVDLCEQIETVTRKALAELLDGGFTEDQVGLQTTLMSLEPDSLGDGLLGFGLSCSHLALYTAQPPIEDGPGGLPDQEFTGQKPQLAHN